MKQYATARFGQIEIEDSQIIRFQKGIPAFDTEREFTLIKSSPEIPYVFLQSLQTEDLAFLLASPYDFFPNYEFTLDDDSVAELEIVSPEEIQVFVILAMPSGGTVNDITANLVAPLVINATNNQAKQVILDKSIYHTQHRLFDDSREDS